MRGLEQECFDGSGSCGRGTAQHWERFRNRGKNRLVYEGINARENRLVYEGINAREISSRKPDIWGYDRRVYNQATMFFFTNFPEDWKHESMWQTFRKYGRVLDIYSPFKKSRMGSRFGFVRFLDIRNECELEHQLEQIWVGEFKLWVNRPRFKGKESIKRSNQGHREKEGVRVQRTYVEVVKGKLESGAATKNGKQVKREKEHCGSQISNHGIQQWLQGRDLFGFGAKGFQFMLGVLSGSDDVSLETWSLANGLEDELSDAFLGGGSSKNSWNTTAEKKDGDDVEAEEEVRKEVETREERSHYRWKQDEGIQWAFRNAKPSGVPKPNESRKVSNERGMKEIMSKFSLGSHNRVASESVTDSGIENKNESLHRGAELYIAEKIWAFAREIGVGDYGNKTERGLKRLKSDHCPILMKNSTIDWGPKPFHFFDVWLDSPGCKELVDEVWSSTVISYWYGYRLKEKLKATKKALKLWSRNMVSKTDSNIKRCEGSITAIDLKGEAAPLSEEDVQLRRNSFVELWKHQKTKESMWCQKARKTWIKDGDANTKFFHRAMRDLIKGDVMGFANDFHKNGRLVKGVNSSFIALISKVNNPQKIEEFKPTFLIGVMYKVIAKLITNRISSILDSIIGESQMAFIRGRQMVDSIVIANETIDAAKRNKKASFVSNWTSRRHMIRLCGDNIEDANYLVLHCKVAFSVKSKCAQWWRFISVQPETCHEDFEQHKPPAKDPLVRAGWDVIWFSTRWSLWMARNAKSFKNQEYDVDRTFELVQLRAFIWIKGKTTRYSFSLHDCMLEPVLSLKDKRGKQHTSI
ncbi:hypothetical protein SLEP1_g12255 [Rubroshorea leprosula]|uniref:RRM domain-containing protein n=1 Tax=Rubroshorea leprosula TaxID=152421 RepID=A0AAV5IHR6_9ROSI|nr:hypothetical protein SLEP1_g12255 [Rubroshorea leprosula]